MTRTCPHIKEVHWSEPVARFEPTSVTVNVVSAIDNGDGTVTMVFDQPGTLIGLDWTNWDFQDNTGTDLGEPASAEQTDDFTFVISMGTYTFLPVATWQILYPQAAIDWDPNIGPNAGGDIPYP